MLTPESMINDLRIDFTIVFTLKLQDKDAMMKNCRIVKNRFL